MAMKMGIKIKDQSHNTVRQTNDPRKNSVKCKAS